MLEEDEQWKAYPLNIPRANIQVLKAADMFESEATKAAGSGR